jgi:hypothetical protein
LVLPPLGKAGLLLKAIPVAFSLKLHFKVLTAVDVLPSSEIVPCSSYVLPAALWFLPRVILDPEDGSNIFHRSVGLHTDYTAQYPFF